MKRKILKNVRGQTIGLVDEDEQGRKLGKDVHGKLVGRYEPKSDQTYNVEGQLKSHGDTLSSLITDDWKSG